MTGMEISLQLDILCTLYWNDRYWAKSDTGHISHVLPRTGVHGNKKNLPASSSGLSVVNFSPRRALSHKYVVNRVETFITWIAFRYTAESDSDKPKCNKNGTRLTAKHSGDKGTCWIVVDLLTFIIT